MSQKFEKLKSLLKELFQLDLLRPLPHHARQERRGNAVFGPFFQPSPYGQPR